MKLFLIRGYESGANCADVAEIVISAECEHAARFDAMSVYHFQEIYSVRVIE